ncbi:MAG: hypothetical protein H7317_05725 [Pseudorhodobacter sp.]|nr:hypothetical protein [Pseudorhodobacter sp.]
MTPVALGLDASVFLGSSDLQATSAVTLQLAAEGGLLTLRLFGPPQVLERPLQVQVSTGQTVGGAVRVAGAVVLTLPLPLTSQPRQITIRGLEGMTGLLARLEAAQDPAQHRAQILHTESLQAAAPPDHEPGPATRMFLDRHNPLYGTLAVAEVTQMPAGTPHDVAIARLLAAFSSDGDPAKVAPGLRLLMTSGKR